jgi:hypothetical protein
MQYFVGTDKKFWLGLIVLAKKMQDFEFIDIAENAIKCFEKIS